MKRKGLLKLIVAVALAGVLAIALVMTGCAPEAGAPTPAAPAPAAPAPEAPHWDLRYQGIGPPSDVDPYTTPFIKSIETMSAGRINIERYYSCELVPDDQLLQAVKAGTVDFTISVSALNGELTQTSGVEAWLVFSVESPIELDALWYEDGIFEIIEEDYAEFGVQYIGPWQFESCDCIISTEPIETYEDLDGLKMSSYPMFSCPFTAAGVTTVNVPAEEFYLSGKTGVLDAVLWCNAYLAHEMSLDEVYPYYLNESPVGAISLSCYMNQEVWDSLTPDLQEIFRVAIHENSFRTLTRRYRGESRARKYFTVTTFSEEDRAKLMAQREPCWEEMARGEPRALQVIEITRNYLDELEATKWHR